VYSGSTRASGIWTTLRGERSSAGDRAAAGRDRVSQDDGNGLCRETDRRRHAIEIAVAAPDEGHLRSAQACGGFNQRVEHRLQVEGRAADDLEHIAGRGLVFERFLKIMGAVAQLVEQPRVLDRDHRLVGKGRD
jgi:hypothetical protein